LGGNYRCLGQHKKGLAETRRALRLEPHNGILQGGLAWNYLALNRFDEARAAVEQALARGLDHESLHLVLYFLAFLEGDQAAMEQQVTWREGEPGEKDWMLSTQSDTEAYYGRLGKAREFSQRAVESARRADAPETAALWAVNAALREAEFGNAAPARQAAAAAIALAPGRDIKVLAALALARAGEAGQARALVQELERDFPSNTVLTVYWLPTIRATLELHRGDTARAIEFLQATVPYELGGPPQLQLGSLYPIYVRGQAYLLAGRGDEAATEFQRILDHRGIVLNFPLGALAHLGLARARALADDIPQSRKHYQDFLALWKDADPAIPVLRAAKAEYAQLQELVASTPAN
jgi:tetratricopeptide (TPR) repeat protein